MRNVASDEVEKELKFRERIVVFVFRKTILKMYKLGVAYEFNNK